MSLGKVKFTACGGTDSDKAEAEKLLTLGSEYDVEYVSVHSWSSTYKLVGIEGLFNTCLFEDSEILEKALDDWRKSRYA